MKNNNTTLTERIELMLDVFLLPVIVLFIVLLSGCRIDKETETEDTFKSNRVNTSVCCYCEKPAHDAMLDNGNVQNYHVSVTRKNRKFKDEYIVCSYCWDKYGCLDDIQSTDDYVGCTFWQQAD